MMDRIFLEKPEDIKELVEQIEFLGRHLKPDQVIMVQLTVEHKGVKDERFKEGE